LIFPKRRYIIEVEKDIKLLEMVQDMQIEDRDVTEEQDGPNDRAKVPESNGADNRAKVIEVIEADNRVDTGSNEERTKANREFYTPYRATEVVNDELAKLGLTPVQRQMIYQYSMTGRIKAAKMVRKNKSGGERLVWQIGDADLDKWLSDYVKSKLKKRQK
jgi:hypothetical protein